MRRAVRISILFLVLLFVVFLFYASLPKVVTVSYSKLDLELSGRKDVFTPLSFACLHGIIMSSLPPRPSPCITSDLSLVYNRVSYPLNSFTSATLASLGFLVQVLGNDRYYATLVNGSVLLDFTLEKGSLPAFDIEDSSATSSLCQVSYRGGPALDLPLSKQQMESVFGKPDAIRTFVDPEFLSLVKTLLTTLNPFHSRHRP